MNRTLGLVGGTSWVSTIDYYRFINEGVNAKLGGNHFARCVIHSFSYADIQTLTFKRDWDGVFGLIAPAAHNLVRSGAEGIVLCANTMHVIADRLAADISVPIIHIVDNTADAIVAKGIDRVLLLGTRFTMEMDFFRDRLRTRGLTAVIPDDADREFIHGSIFGELGRGIVTAPTKQRYLDIIGRFGAQGVQGAILGCTEIPLVVKPGDTSLPTFDTTAIHATAAVAFATGERNPQHG
jgi:aspartate racemase